MGGVSAGHWSHPAQGAGRAEPTLPPSRLPLILPQPQPALHPGASSPITSRNTRLQNAHVERVWACVSASVSSCACVLKPHLRFRL